jgi:hypothetical protein
MRPKPDPGVLAWADGLAPGAVAITAKGTLQVRIREPGQRVLRLRRPRSAQGSALKRRPEGSQDQPAGFCCGSGNQRASRFLIAT